MNAVSPYLAILATRGRPPEVVLIRGIIQQPGGWSQIRADVMSDFPNPRLAVDFDGRWLGPADNDPSFQ